MGMYYTSISTFNQKTSDFGRANDASKVLDLAKSKDYGSKAQRHCQIHGEETSKSIRIKNLWTQTDRYHFSYGKGLLYPN